MSKMRTAADRIVIEERVVDDPMITDAELAYQRRKNPDRIVGKVSVTGNAMSRIGALCFVRSREVHHELAAERFKLLYEGLYGSGMPAIDAGRIQVDHTIVASDGGMARRIDKASDIRNVFDALGPRVDFVVATVVLGSPIVDQVDVLPSGYTNRRQARKTEAALLDALEEIARLWGIDR